MAYPIGGRLVVGYSSGGREFELSLSLAPFDPATFAYTAGGMWMPTEAGVGDTFAALAAVMAPYYDASWVITLKAVWAQSGIDAAMLPTVPAVSSVNGTALVADVTDPALIRGFTFYNALGNRQRARLFMVATNESGARRPVTRTSGGFDNRDQVLVTYLSSPATGLRCWDGVPFPDNGHVYVRSMPPLAAAVSTTTGGTSIFAGECLAWPLGGKVCNPSLDHMTIETPGGTFALDTTGITLPGGHRLEVV